MHISSTFMFLTKSFHLIVYTVFYYPHSNSMVPVAGHHHVSGIY